MKCLFAILILSIPITSFCQSSMNDFQLDTIQDFRIKIDGGCGFYRFQKKEFDSTSEKNCFVIDRFKRGFFAIKSQHDYIYVKRISSEYKKNGSSREVFKGNGFSCILTTNSNSTTDTSLRQGILEMYNGKKKITVEVSGHVDDNSP